jgi:glycosyltransferase involved in cell wall biosynthesis
MKPIARVVRQWWNGMPDNWRRGLAFTYPHYSYLLEQLRPEVCVYYNIDDYRLYWPNQAEAIRRLEMATVRKADLTICVSELRSRQLRDWVPEAAERIHHVPHGAPEAFLTPEPMERAGPSPADLRALPRPLLGYVGSLEDRVDWRLMNRVADAFPDASLVVVGRASAPSKAEWWRECARFLARPNVHAVGWRSQALLASYYQSFDVSLIPDRSPVQPGV